MKLEMRKVMKTIRYGSNGDDVKLLQSLLGIKPVDGIFGKQTERAVKDFQESRGLVADGIVGAKTWNELTNKSKGMNIKKSKRIIKEIIVHCTATQEGKDFTVADIDKWHKARGFSGIGYHYVIYRDGSIHDGRNVDVAGAHTIGHNAQSIGVSYIGGVAVDGKTPKDTRTQAQKDSLRNLLKELRKLYPAAKIYGHRNFANKACPSFDAKSEYKDI